MKTKNVKLTATCTRPDISASSAYRYAKCRCPRCRAWKSDASKRTNDMQLAAERSRLWRVNNLTRSRQNAKDYQRLHPEKLLGWQLKKYGINLTDYRRMLKQSKGRCMVCKKSPSGLQHGKRRLCVDHDKVTQKVRGLLCGGCNVGLGHLKHSVALLRAAISYLNEKQSSRS